MTQIYDQPTTLRRDPETYSSLPAASNSAVSWGAIFAGAAAAASLSMILLMLGAGLGLTSISPWENDGLDASTVGIAAIVWLAFTQIAASGMGGYLAGRLRTKWVATHSNEVYFRDTAHGFLTWAVASLISAILLTTTAGSIIGGSAKAIGAVAGGAATATMGGVANATSGSDPSTQYFIQSLFRTMNTDTANTSAVSTNTQTPGPAPQQEVSPAELGEVTGIFAHSITTGSLPKEDQQYVAQLISQKTGISQSEAEQRVTATYEKAQNALKEAKTKAQQAADEARKTTSYITLWTFISLLIGAFVASLCATFGGRQRDL
ncbi:MULTISPECIES: hypothetical protein [Enterobacter]|jgi:hypothetical protein|uniref:Uncharacterized protein n=1 Tax=Enterobacter cancerogenus TaxID=69218 RepID=A0ABX8KPM2_9ENTR|nr:MULTISPECIES: hypothetical protein [Enterobacter]EFC55744.1 hypothetical protein ENTCAN_07338 [Enterobacter cancerogenus ATCC 35316]MDI3425398.1 hypothetical protein [Enterobacter sp. V87_3]QXA50961.1 hypothetical protein I6L58_07985 [Enterobacter cancerogenus]CAD5352965.1 conserved membrane protein of unknown function [Enterobacter cancerogenus]